jgi:hypothetical protein
LRFEVFCSTSPMTSPPSQPFFIRPGHQATHPAAC